jgi:hypothetical protein
MRQYGTKSKVTTMHPVESATTISTSKLVKNSDYFEHPLEMKCSLRDLQGQIARK